MQMKIPKLEEGGGIKQEERGGRGAYPPVKSVIITIQYQMMRQSSLMIVRNQVVADGSIRHQE